MKEVIKLMTEQIMAQSKELLKMKEEKKKEFSAGLEQGKVEAQAQVEDLQVKLGESKVQLAQLKSSVQDLEDFIEMAKETQRVLENDNILKDTQIQKQLGEIMLMSKMEEDLKSKEAEIEKLNIELDKAKQKIQSLVKMQTASLRKNKEK